MNNFIKFEKVQSMGVRLKYRRFNDAWLKNILKRERVQIVPLFSNSGDWYNDGHGLLDDGQGICGY